MLNIEKFKNKLLCICKNTVLFEIIPEIECDWGCHTVIQCPKCEELFSIDIKCPAFETIEKLLKENITLYTNAEQLSYLSESHPL
jgi:hypothetical protein|tara:strand:+ start:144 stop:398 length:255 start_codon:yes stop_codon:yes gene_type:complete